MEFLVVDKELALVRRLCLAVAQQTGLTPPEQATKTTTRTSMAAAAPEGGVVSLGGRTGAQSGGSPSPTVALRAGGRRKQAVPSAAPTGMSLPFNGGGNGGGGGGGGVPRVSPKPPVSGVPPAAVTATAGPPSPKGPLPAAGSGMQHVGSGDMASPTNQSSMTVLQARFYAKLRDMRGEGGGPGGGDA